METNKKIVFLVTLIGSFIMSFMGSSINIALPSIGVEFKADAVVLVWIATSFLLSMAMFLVPFGRIADIYGRKKIFSLGMLVYSAASLGCAFAPSELWLVLFRVIQGIGSAMFSATGIALLISVYPPEARGKAIGINIAATYLGLSLGPVIGGLITEHLGWRFLFFINIPFTLAILFLVFWKIKGDWSEAQGEKFDWGGSVIFCLVLVALMVGFSLMPGYILPGAAFIAASFIGVWVFVRYESKSDAPIIDISVFRRNRVFIFSNLAALINYCTTAGVGFLLSLYLQYIKGFSPDKAGLVLIAQPVMMTIFAPIAGRLSDRIEPRIVASVGMALTSLSFCLLVFLGWNTGVFFVIAGLVILGSGFGLFSSPNTNAIISAVDKKMYGIASASVSTMRIIGQMLSMGITTLLFSIYIGHSAITPANYPEFLSTMRMAFIVFAAICFVGIFASLSRGKVRGLVSEASASAQSRSVNSAGTGL